MRYISVLCVTSIDSLQCGIFSYFMNISNILSIPLEIDFEFLFFLILFHIFVYYCHLEITLGFLGGTSDKEPLCKCRSDKICRLNPWVRKIPWKRVWQPTPVFLAGESPWTEETGGLSPQRWKESYMTEVSQHSTAYSHLEEKL